jgi:hypothetical protein
MLLTQDNDLDPRVAVLGCGVGNDFYMLCLGLNTSIQIGGSGMGSGLGYENFELVEHISGRSTARQLKFSGGGLGGGITAFGSSGDGQSQGEFKLEKYRCN